LSRISKKQGCNVPRTCGNVLDGRRATTNKIDFTETVHLAPGVEWVKEARWVEDGKFFTSSGVSAGIDMALGAIADLYGKNKAEETAYGCEYIWNKNADEDPFATLAGLVSGKPGTRSE